MSEIVTSAGSGAVLPLAKAYAASHGFDLAIPACRGSGLGNAIVYTRLVEEWARSRGRPASIVTAPLSPATGVVPGEDPFAIWRHNPYVASIRDASEVDPLGFSAVDEERRSLVQLNHIIENVCFAYGLKPRFLRASLFLSRNEMQWALEVTRHLPRPLVCLHPGGNTQSRPGTPWHSSMWYELLRRLRKEVGFFQIGRTEFGDQDLGLDNPGRTIRQTMALIWSADAVVCFDSSSMNMATAFEVPTVALFDMSRKYEAELRYGTSFVPSIMLRWAYPQNRNVALMENDDGTAALSLVIDALRSRLPASKYR